VASWLIPDKPEKAVVRSMPYANLSLVDGAGVGGVRRPRGVGFSKEDYVDGGLSQGIEKILITSSDLGYQWGSEEDSRSMNSQLSMNCPDRNFHLDVH
jgi:hypothetical protein